MRQQKLSSTQRNKDDSTTKLGFSFSTINPVREQMPLPKSAQAPAFRHDFSRVKLGPVQAKLTIGQPNDKYEQEADRIADQVMNMPDPRMQRACADCDEEQAIKPKPIADQISPLVQRQIEPEDEEELPIQPKLTSDIAVQRQETGPEDEEDKPEAIQEKRNDSQSSQASPKLVTQLNSMQNGGQPLTKFARDFFEPRFGYDLSQVKVFTDHRTAQLAGDINAKAFTYGKKVFFGAGQYQPETKAGQRLIAHELSHVLQQSQTSLRRMYRINSPEEKVSQIPHSTLQRACQYFSTHSSPDTYCQTRAEAQALVTTACPPDRNCFIRNDGPVGYRWRPNPGYGCAHYVAHRLNISTGNRHRRCFVGRTLTITDLIDGRTRHDLADAQPNDIWTDGGHSGVVRQVGTGTHAGQVRISACGVTGSVSTYWRGDGDVYR